MQCSCNKHSEKFEMSNFSDKRLEKCVPPRIIGGYTSISSQNWGTINRGVTMKIICYDGYRLQGNQFVTCLGNNQYDQLPGSCDLQWCYIDIPHSGAYNISVNLSSSYKFLDMRTRTRLQIH